MFPRYLTVSVRAALADTPVVMLTGPRQGGKSTLVRTLVPADAYYTLDDIAVRAAASADPDGFIAALPDRAAIDEVQRAPDLLLAIKAAVDRDRAPGRFVLTGSADLLTLPRVAESLAGRMQRFTLWPLAQAEIEGVAPRFVDALFARAARPSLPARDPRAALIERTLRGGYPEAVQRDSQDRRAAWFDSYLDAIVQRDLRDLSNLKHLVDVPRLLALVAGAAPSTVNISSVSRASGIPRSSVDRYVTLLQQLYLLVPLPAWHASLTVQQVRSHRIAFGDTGLLAHLLGLSPAALSAWDDAKIGPLLENLAAMEVLKQAAWSAHLPHVYHWRTSRGQEVDIVLRDRAGRLCGVEVKASASVGSSDFRHLRTLKDAAGDRFVSGVVLYTGEQVVPFSDGLAAWPMQTLWAG